MNGSDACRSKIFINISNKYNRQRHNQVNGVMREKDTKLLPLYCVVLHRMMYDVQSQSEFSIEFAFDFFFLSFFALFILFFVV